MAYISYDKLWRSEVYNNVPANDRWQDINPNQLILKVNNIYKKDENITRKIEPSNDEDVMNKSYLNTKLWRLEGHIS